MRRPLILGAVLLLAVLSAATVDISRTVAGRSAGATTDRRSVTTPGSADPDLRSQPTSSGTAASTIPEASAIPETSAGQSTGAATASSSADTGSVNRMSARCRVSGQAADLALVQQVARICVAAARTVDQAWGTAWRTGTGRRTRVVIATDVPALAALLNRDSTAGLADVAAVTVGPVGAPAQAVYVNGVAFTGLSELGRQVVLTHELVHVATRATGDGDAPTWLEEGYADHVAYLDSGLAPDQIAGEALAAVLPTRLPSTADFDASGNAAAVAYGRAWAAVELVAERLPKAAGLRRFYRTAAQHGVSAALRSAGFSRRSAFVAAWRRLIVEYRAE